MKKIKYIISILFVIIVIFILILIINNRNYKSGIDFQEESSEQREKPALEVVTNSAMYFTVESCVDTYIDYIAKQDDKAVYEILDYSYLQKFNITEDNVMNYVENISDNTSFDTKKMLSSRGQGENLQEYYVYGILKTREGNKVNKKDIYLTVNINLEKMIYSIIPNEPNEEVFDE